MVITEKELEELTKINVDIEKISSLSYDGQNLLTRIPQEIKNHFKLSKGDKIRWLIKIDENKINLEFVKENGKDQKEKNN